MSKSVASQDLETAISAIQTIYREEVSEMEDLLVEEQEKVLSLEDENKTLKLKLRSLNSSLYGE